MKNEINLSGFIIRSFSKCVPSTMFVRDMINGGLGTKTDRIHISGDQEPADDENLHRW